MEKFILVSKIRSFAIVRNRNCRWQLCLVDNLNFHFPLTLFADLLCRLEEIPKELHSPIHRHKEFVPVSTLEYPT